MTGLISRLFKEREVGDRACSWERRGDTIEFRCDVCTLGQRDLDKCLGEMLKVLSQQSAPDAIVRRGTIDQVMTRDVCEVLHRLALLRSACSDFATTPDRGQRCDGCPARPSSIFARVASSITDPPVEGLLSTLDSMRPMDRACTDCISISRDRLITVANGISDLGRAASSGAEDA